MSGTNTHIHLPPNFSAFESVEQTVSLAADEGITILGASNYYDFGVYAEFEHLCHQRGITPLFGLEVVVRIPELAARDIRVNDPGNPGKMYLCGKDILKWADPTPEAVRLLKIIRESDSRRIAEMIDRLTRLFAASGVNTGLNTEEVIDMVVARHGCPRETVYLQERHVAQAFQEALFREVHEGERARALSAVFGAPISADDPIKVQGSIRSRLMKAGKPAFVDESFIGFNEAMLLIRELGGVPCYPVLADGADPICEYEADVDALIADLVYRDIRHAEFIPVRNVPEILRRYVLAFHDAGFSVTAGTEHNTLDLIPLTPTCQDGEPIPDDVQTLFDEGARRLVERI